MEWHATELIDRQGCGEDVYSCRFERPEGYEFAAGQYFMLRLGADAGAPTKPFSHASAPGDPWIEVTTHFSDSEYKRDLAQLKPGARAFISPALGRLRVPTHEGPVTFLVGGVGITPVRSIVRDAVQESTGLVATILYGNRTPECAPYRAELDTYAPRGIRTVHVFERTLNDPNAEEGLITSELVRRYADPSQGPFVTTGPPAMVAAMERVMDDLGIPSARRWIEKFGTG